MDAFLLVPANDGIASILSFFTMDKLLCSCLTLVDSLLMVLATSR